MRARACLRAHVRVCHECFGVLKYSKPLGNMGKQSKQAAKQGQNRLDPVLTGEKGGLCHAVT
jgi:hypothetical protein